jgi:hypothetical protein
MELYLHSTRWLRGMVLIMRRETSHLPQLVGVKLLPCMASPCYGVFSLKRKGRSRIIQGKILLVILKCA